MSLTNHFLATKANSGHDYKPDRSPLPVSLTPTLMPFFKWQSFQEISSPKVCTHLLSSHHILLIVIFSQKVVYSFRKAERWTDSRETAILTYIFNLISSDSDVLRPQIALEADALLNPRTNK
jgi:hypothetical protein